MSAKPLFLERVGSCRVVGLSGNQVNQVIKGAGEDLSNRGLTVGAEAV